MKKRVVSITKLLVSLLLLGILLRTVDPAPVLARLGKSDPTGIFWLFLLVNLQLALAGWRWQMVASLCGMKVALRDALSLTFIGNFFNQTLPSTIGGDIMRVFLAGRAGCPVARATSSVLADRVLALLALLVLSAITLPMFIVIVPDGTLRGALFVTAAGGLGGFAACLALGEWIAGFIPFRRLGNFLADFTRDMRRIMPPGRREWLILVLSLVIHIMTVATMALLAHMLAIPLPPLEALVLIPPVILLTVLPISLAGWGVREGAMVVILAEIGTAPSDALALSLAFGLLLALSGGPGGLLWIFRKGTSSHAGK